MWSRNCYVAVRRFNVKVHILDVLLAYLNQYARNIQYHLILRLFDNEVVNMLDII